MAKTTKFYGTGRRKSSIARVYIAPGTGKITINKKDMDEYFGLDTLKVIVKQPLVATGTDGKFDSEAPSDFTSRPPSFIQIFV